MFGAKGSVKNRVYQFWLIRLWKEKRKKRKEKALLKHKKLIEEQRKVIEKVVGRRNTKIWKLAEPPKIFHKKEGVVITLYPIGKKPDKVIEVIEEKPKIGIGQEELEKKLEKLEKETVKVVSKVDVETKKKDLKPEELEVKKKILEQDLDKIETLQKEYQQIEKRNPKLSNMKFIKDQKIKSMVVHVETLKQAEKICKEELSRIEIVLKNVEIKKEEPAKEEKQEIKKENSKQQNETEKIEKVSSDYNSSNKHHNNSSSIQKPANNLVKEHIMVGAIAGGTLIVFPTLLRKTGQEKRALEPNQKKTLDEKDLNRKTDEYQNEKVDIQKETNHEKEKLKLYHSKLEASFEAEILVKAELERQKNYLRRMNEKIEQIDISRRVKYRFRGLHHLLGQILTFTLGIFTIPFSRNRIFGTALGLTLIGNSIRGMRNSLRLTEERNIYIEWKDFTKQIYNEQLALKQLNTMIVTSLNEIKELKIDMETEFYGKISFEEYEKMKAKLEVIELKLNEKQKQIMEVEEQLQKTEEKNKVKVKEMEELRRQS